MVNERINASSASNPSRALVIAVIGPLIVNSGRLLFVVLLLVLPTTPREWVSPVLALLLCLTVVALWYGLGALFDPDPSATGSILEH
jgi:hypothetical protein